MKKIIAILLALVMVVGTLAACSTEKPVETKPNETQGDKPVETQPKETEPTVDKSVPRELDIMVLRHSNVTNDASDLYLFKYLEWWLHEQGWNVTIKVSQFSDADEQISLMLGTDTLPDLILGKDLSPTNAVVYGAGEHIVFDWTPYLNEEDMPNFSKWITDDALKACTSTDGHVYALPYLNSTDPSYKTPSADFGTSDRFFVNTKWLEEVGMDVPTNLEELLAALRAFKDIKLESGEEVIPLINNQKYFEKWVWSSLGYYGGGTGGTNGETFSLKDEQVWLPYYTEDYQYYVELMHTLYTEGLISADFFTMDGTTARGLVTAGRCGFFSDSTLGQPPEGTIQDWRSVPVMPIYGNDDVYISLSTRYSANRMWGNASTECPELIVAIVDFLFSDEGAAIYRYGPQQGQDPLGLQDGWYMTEEGTITCKKVEDGTYKNFEAFARQELYPYDNVGRSISKVDQWAMAGFEGGKADPIEYTDALTGETIIGYDFGNRDDLTTADGWWRYINVEASSSHVTKIMLPKAYLSEEDAVRAAELKLLLDEHYVTETARFITGQRPLSEVPEFMKELESMNVQEYVELYVNAYSAYLEATFG